MTIFETDPRLIRLTRTNVTVHNAHQLALRDGDDMDALIMAMLVLVNENEALRAALNEYAKHTPPTFCVDARSVAVFFDEQKESL
jgi:hypothetical protein